MSRETGKVKWQDKERRAETIAAVAYTTNKHSKTGVAVALKFGAVLSPLSMLAPWLVFAYIYLVIAPLLLIMGVTEIALDRIASQ